MNFNNLLFKRYMRHSRALVSLLSVRQLLSPGGPAQDQSLATISSQHLNSTKTSKSVSFVSSHCPSVSPPPLPPVAIDVSLDELQVTDEAALCLKRKVHRLRG